MTETKPYKKAWFKDIVARAKESMADHPAETLASLVDSLDKYIAYQDEMDSHKGRGMTEAKLAALRENAKKGGWKKGRPRKHAPESSQE